MSDDKGKREQLARVLTLVLPGLGHFLQRRFISGLVFTAISFLYMGYLSYETIMIFKDVLGTLLEGQVMPPMKGMKLILILVSHGVILAIIIGIAYFDVERFYKKQTKDQG